MKLTKHNKLNSLECKQWKLYRIFWNKINLLVAQGHFRTETELESNIECTKFYYRILIIACVFEMFLLQNRNFDRKLYDNPAAFRLYFDFNSNSILFIFFKFIISILEIGNNFYGFSHTIYF